MISDCNTRHIFEMGSIKVVDAVFTFSSRKIPFKPDTLWSIFLGSSYFARYSQRRSQFLQFVCFVQVSTIFVFSEEAVNILWSILSRRPQRDTVFVFISFHINVSVRKCSWKKLFTWFKRRRWFGISSVRATSFCLFHATRWIFFSRNTVKYFITV